MKTQLITTMLAFGCTHGIFAQETPATGLKDNTDLIKSATDKKVLENVRTQIVQTNSDDEKLVLGTTMNMMQQKTIMGYLSGTSDLSLSTFTATYSTDDDRLKFGINIPVYDRDNFRLKHLISPVFEADIKESFSTIRKEGKCDSDNLRAGIKYTLLPANSVGSFYKNTTQKRKMNALRTHAYYKFVDSLLKESENEKGSFLPIDKQNLAGEGNYTLEEIYADKEPTDPKKLKKALLNYLGEKEMEFVEENEFFTRFRTYWFSFWGMLPLTETNRFVSLDSTHAFQKVKYYSWEINVQGSFLFDFKKGGTLYLSSWFKICSNNTINADLLTNVDYNKYQTFPSETAQYLSQAVFENNKAFVGNFWKFSTGNLNSQAVYLFGLRDYLIRPGISARLEVNIGNYHPTNFRFGVPLVIKGKESPINFELQARWDDLWNYNNDRNFSGRPTFGISVGVPITPLY